MVRHPHAAILKPYWEFLDGYYDMAQAKKGLIKFKKSGSHHKFRIRKVGSSLSYNYIVEYKVSEIELNKYRAYNR